VTGPVSALGGAQSKEGQPAATPLISHGFHLGAAVGSGYSMPLLRQVDVDLHLRHTRSPAHALGKGSRQSRHFLIFCSEARRASRSASQTSAPESQQPSWQSAKAPECSLKLVNSSSTTFATSLCCYDLKRPNAAVAMAFPAKRLRISGHQAG